MWIGLGPGRRGRTAFSARRPAIRFTTGTRSITMVWGPSSRCSRSMLKVLNFGGAQGDAAWPTPTSIPRSRLATCAFRGSGVYRSALVSSCSPTSCTSASAFSPRTPSVTACHSNLGAIETGADRLTSCSTRIVTGPEDCRMLGKVLDFAAPLGQLRVLLAAARMHHALPPHHRALELDTSRGQRTLPHLSLMYSIAYPEAPDLEPCTTNAMQSLRRSRVNRARVRFTSRSLRSPLRRSTVASQWPRAS